MTAVNGPITVTPKATEDGLRFESLGDAALDRQIAGEIPAGVRKSNATKLVPPG